MTNTITDTFMTSLLQELGKAEDARRAVYGITDTDIPRFETAHLDDDAFTELVEARGFQKVETREAPQP